MDMIGKIEDKIDIDIMKALGWTVQRETWESDDPDLPKMSGYRWVATSPESERIQLFVPDSENVSWEYLVRIRGKEWSRNLSAAMALLRSVYDVKMVVYRYYNTGVVAALFDDDHNLSYDKAAVLDFTCPEAAVGYDWRKTLEEYITQKEQPYA